MTNTNISLPTLIEKSKGQFAMALGGATPQQRMQNAERFARLCLTAFRQTPKLMQCDPYSVLGAMMTCAQLNLEPNTPQGLAYLIPYNRECQFQIGYRGLMQIMYRSGAIASFNADVVYRQEYENGLFEYESGITPRLTHKIDLLGSARSGRPDEIIAAYAAVVLKTGEPIVRLVTKAEIEQARALNRGNSPAWRDHYAAMAIKTAIKRLANWLPMTKLMDAIAAEDVQQTAAPVQEEKTGEVNAPVTVDTINRMLAEPEPVTPTKPAAPEPDPKPEPEQPAPREEQANPEPEHKEQPAQADEDERFTCPSNNELVSAKFDCSHCSHREGCPAFND